MLKDTVYKLIRLVLGLFICALGIVFSINANLGLAPWDVLHQGISNHVGITIGTASIIIGITIVLANVLLGENIGWGTIINILCIGTFMDLIIASKLVPSSNSILNGILMIIISMTLMGFGMAMYMGCGLGSGPRDGMMVALQKRTSKPVSIVRGSMEVGALTVGYLLGGKVGIGTVINAFVLGYFIKIVFRICKLDSSKIKHRFIVDDIKYIKSLSIKGNRELADVQDSISE